MTLYITKSRGVISLLSVVAYVTEYWYDKSEQIRRIVLLGNLLFKTENDERVKITDHLPKLTEYIDLYAVLISHLVTTKTIGLADEHHLTSKYTNH